MRTGDDYAASSGGGGGGGMGGELADFGTYLGAAPGGGGTRWGSAQGGPTWGRTTPQHMMYTRFHHDASNNSYEAEDVIGGYSEPSSRNVPRGGGAGTGSAGGGGRSGLYYSPPGTSYTIVERPSSGMHSYRDRDREYHTSSKTGTSRTGYPVQTSSRSSTLNSMNKKRPISPEQVLKLFGNSHTTTSAPSGAHSLTVSNSKDRSSRRSPASSPASTTHQVYNPASRSQYQPPSIHELVTRTVTMSRDPPDGTHGFGICVKGGKDAGVGVYISRVEEGSVAERSGLRPGDSILEVNGTPFTSIAHEEALKMLKSCRKISMTVRSPTLPGMLQTPGGGGGPYMLRQTCSWMDRQGRPVSPPPEYSRQRFAARTPSSTGTGAIRRVDLCIEPGQSLGLMIRGGVEYNLGIFITGVDKDSVADRAGLLIGDQILEVNGQSFLDVTHDEAVNQLKFHKRMSLVVRDVGKVPHSCTAYDREIWDATPSGKRSAALQMVEEKARSVLPKSDFPTLCYYTDEYTCRKMSVDAFVAVMMELLNTPEKYTLLTELREIIAPEDRTRFDEIVYRRESDSRIRDHRDYDIRHTSRRKPGLLSDTTNHSLLMSSLHDIPGPDYSNELGYGHGDSDPEYRSPSEDSGLGLAVADRTARLTRRPASATPSCGAWYGPSAPSAKSGGSSVPLQRPTTGPPAIVANTSDLDEETPPTQDYGSGDEGGEVGTGRRHSSPGDSRSGSATALHQPQPEYDEDTSGYLGGLRSWTQKVKSWYWGRPLELAHKLSRSFDMKDDQNLLDASDGGSGNIRRHQSMQRLSRTDLQHQEGGEHGDANRTATIVPDHQGNLRITVKKSKPILGIAIEGGANTKHPLPRIINIHENGAAYDAGGLEVGQLILEVDGQRVEGLQHQEVARLIAESFARRDRQEIEFLVVEAKKSNLEPKPTALIFLEA